MTEEVVNGAVVAQYTCGSWRISQNRAGTVGYYGYDAGTSVRELFNSTGAITDTYDYDAFGNAVAQSGSTINEFLYRGEQFDSAIGMHYLRARWYRSGIGRFSTADRIVSEPPARPKRAQTKRHSVQSVSSLFAYTAGDPVNRIDPSGNNFVEEGEIDSYDALAARGRIPGSDLEFHHIIPKRFACVLGASEGLMLAIALDSGTHQFYDNMWADEIPTDGRSCEATVREIADAARLIYGGESDIMAVVNAWIEKMTALGVL